MQRPTTKKTGFSDWSGLEVNEAARLTKDRQRWKSVFSLSCCRPSVGRWRLTGLTLVLPSKGKPAEQMTEANRLSRISCSKQRVSCCLTYLLTYLLNGTSAHKRRLCTDFDEMKQLLNDVYFIHFSDEKVFTLFTLAISRNSQND